MINSIVVAGGGTMGSGIALAAAKSGFDVVLFDNQPAVLEKARTTIGSNLDFLVSKSRISEGDKGKIFERIFFTDDIEGCKGDLIIEAIIELPAAKTQLFNTLSEINSAHTIFASNTSSLSITEIQKGIPHPERVAGMHFFNPAHIMKLVEVVKGLQTSPEVTDQIMDVCRKMDKVPVLCKDAPGFIVNRVARHYYLEAMRIVESGIAGIEEVDDVMEATGFKMGPFRLMDLIGMDINLSVSESLYNALGETPRLKPSPLQVKKVADGDLGRKSGKGFYTYNK